MSLMSSRRKLLPLLLGGWLFVLALSPATPPTTTVTVSVELGQVVTATVVLANWGQPATTVRLYTSQAPLALPAAPAAPLSAQRVPLPNTPGPVTAELLNQFSTAPDGQADMLIYLADQADLSAAANLSDWNTRGEAVYQTLTAHAARTQQSLLQALQTQGYQPRSYWIVNAVAVRGDETLARWLSTQASVGLVGANTLHQVEPASLAPASADPIAWGVAKIGAPNVWADWDVQGESIVVANIDTGVAYTHSALLTNYRGWSPAGLSHDYNWYDPVTTTLPCEPLDPVGHGTHTMGIIAGQAAQGHPAIGVAPGVRWIAARGCGGTFCADETILASAQWLLAPTDCHLANPRPDLRPHIISNSWGAPGNDPWYTGYVEAWNAAGIFSVFAVGNNGLFGACQSASSPSNYAAAFAVGATDAEDYIADFSSRGPTFDNRIKPDVSAPGVAVPSAWPGGGLQAHSGTSMATPHVAGAVALLWSANPQLIGNIAATRQALTHSAQPRNASECGSLPGQVPNNTYGWGRLDAHRAMLETRDAAPWLSVPVSATLPPNATAAITITLDARQVAASGTYQARILVERNNALISIPVTIYVQQNKLAARLTGQLIDRWTGRGIYGRLEIPPAPAPRTDANGYYTLTLPLSSTTLTAAATGYVAQSVALDLNADTQHDFVLMPDQPHLQLNAPALSATLAFGERQNFSVGLSNTGSQPLSVTLSVPPLEWSVVETGSTSLYDLSALPPLLLADDMVYTDTLNLGFSLPIYGQLVNQLYLSSNGWVSVEQPTTSIQSANCLPNASLPAGALAPFWADLDPSITGTVRAGQVASDTFVVSFEKVPHWSETPSITDPTYTFQLALHASGKVEFIYGAMGALPANWSVGVSLNKERGQNLACHRTRPALGNQSWLLENQTWPALWLDPTPAALTLPPGGSAIFTATLRGFGYSPWRSDPFAGVVRLSTNDPLQPVADVPAEVRVTTPPPYNLWLALIQH